MSDETLSEPVYPAPKKEKKWDAKARAEWNRQYRAEIKAGIRKPIKKSDKVSKWNDVEYRKAYDRKRKDTLNAIKKEKKLNEPSLVEKKPNYTMDEKKIILERMLENIKEGKGFEHPHFELGLLTRKTAKRSYESKTQE